MVNNVHSLARLFCSHFNTLPSAVTHAVMLYLLGPCLNTAWYQLQQLYHNDIIAPFSCSFNHGNFFSTWVSIVDILYLNLFSASFTSITSVLLFAGDHQPIEYPATSQYAFALYPSCFLIISTARSVAVDPDFTLAVLFIDILGVAVFFTTPVFTILVVLFTFLLGNAFW